jgi:hypothetical protein
MEHREISTAKGRGSEHTKAEGRMEEDAMTETEAGTGLGYGSHSRCCVMSQTSMDGHRLVSGPGACDSAPSAFVHRSDRLARIAADGRLGGFSCQCV